MAPRRRRSASPPVYQPELSGPVDVRAMVDPENNDTLLLVVDLIEHPVRTAPGRPDTGQFPAQRFPDSPWCSQQFPCEKFRDRGSDPLWQPVEGALRGRC